jgi:hypothetical protein
MRTKCAEAIPPEFSYYRFIIVLLTNQNGGGIIMYRNKEVEDIECLVLVPTTTATIR